MSKISGKQFGEPFKMRVVSGMLVNGSIQITWATGEKASSQIDWGLDSSVPNTTPEFNREPSEMVRYHRVYFPITYLNTEHFFRVRSKTAGGKVGQSAVYSVLTPDKVFQTTDHSLSSELTIVGISEAEEILQPVSSSHDIRPAAQHAGHQEPMGSSFHHRLIDEDQPGVESSAITTSFNLSIT